MPNTKGYRRTDRVKQQIHEVLAALLLREVNDPRAAQVQITSVEVTPDLRHAKVYYSNIEREGFSEEVDDMLGRMSGFLRSQLGNSVRMKYLPSLVFVYDETLDRAERIERLLAEVRPEE